MRLLITLFMLAFAQLFFNVAQASPQAPVKASQHKIDKKSAREDERRKRRPLKTTSKKARPATAEKSKVKKKGKATAVAASPTLTAKKGRASAKTVKPVKTAKQSGAKKSAAKSASARYGRQRGDKKGALQANGRGPLEMSKAHRERYQKARETAMNKLMGQLGKPYLWGGTSPHTGFDCSGLVWYAYKDVVKFKIPRTANEMYHLRDAAAVSRESLEKGDLVFFRINNRGAADHVGVYLGNGRFIQSPRTGKDIQISQLSDDYWERHYVGARRVMTPKTIR